MAVVAVTDSNRRVLDNEAANSGTSTTGLGGGAGVQDEPDVIWQGTQAWSRKLASGGGGWRWTAGATVDMTTGDDQVLMLKLALTNFAALTGYLELRIGQSSGNEQHYRIADDGTQGDVDYPAKGGWLIAPIDVNVTEWIDTSTGTPDLTIVDNYVFYASAFSGSSKVENLIQDSLDIGDGLHLVGGDTAPAGTFLDFLADDEGSPTAGRFGHVTSQEGILFVYGLLRIGADSAGVTTTATEFTESLRTVVWPGGRVDENWNRLYVNIANASTVVTMTNCTFIGRGRVGWKMFFDAENEVGAIADRIHFGGSTANEVVVAEPFQFSNGVAVTYSDEGGTTLSGLTDNGLHYVEVLTTTDDEFYLHTAERGDAFLAASGSRANLVAGTAQENHSLTIGPDTRPELFFAGTSGSAVFTGCTFNNFVGVASIPANVDFINCTFVGCGDIVLSQAATQITGCTFVEPTTGPGDFQMSTTTVSGWDAITGCTWEGNYSSDKDPRWRGGHGLKITVVGALTESWTDNDVDSTTYGPNPATFDASSSGDVDTTNNELTVSHDNFATGDEVFYNDRGGTAPTGLTDGDMYYIRRISANVVSLHYTKYSADNDTDEINISALGTLSGSREHHLGSADAFFLIEQTVENDITINVTGGSTPTYRTTGAADVVTVQQSVTLTINGLTENAYVDIIAGPTGPETEGTSLASGYANSSGVFTQGYSYSSDQSVVIRARKSGIVDACHSRLTSTFTSQTSAARDQVTTADVKLTTGDTTSGTGGDGIYIGGLEKFGEVEFPSILKGLTNPGVAWYYATGTDTWSALTIVDQNDDDPDGKYVAADWQSNGTARITFDDPGAGWVTSTLNSEGPYYYIAAVWDGTGSHISDGTCDKVTLHGGALKKYQPFNTTGTIEDTGLTVTAIWVEDTIAR